MTPQRFDEIVAELRQALSFGQVQSPQQPLPVVPLQPVQTPVTGYDKVLRWDWVWAAGTFVSYTHEQGIGPNGLVVISFMVPSGAQGLGSISIAPYPGDLSGCEREISISASEGDFSLPFPYTRRDVDPSMQFQIGGVSRFAPVLVPGQLYHINIRSPGCVQAGRACDMVIQCSVPS
jgi:hypothetical protein